MPQIEVTFDIDSNGILNVTARDKGTGKEQNIRIEASSGLSDDEIQRMKAEAEANAESDKKEKERVDKINAADGLIFQTEKQLKEYGDKLPEDKKAPVEEALASLKEVHKNQDLDGIEREMEKLNQAWTAASEEMYKATQGAEAGQDGAQCEPQNGDAQGGSDEVQDVDFEEVKDK